MKAIWRMAIIVFCIGMGSLFPSVINVSTSFINFVLVVAFSVLVLYFLFIEYEKEILKEKN